MGYGPDKEAVQSDGTSQVAGKDTQGISDLVQEYQL